MARLFIIYLMVLASPLLIKAQDYQWLNSLHGANEDEGFGITVDFAGHPICCGSFTSDTLFAGGMYLTNNTGNTDAYIVKYDLSGNAIWMDNPGGSHNQVAYAVASDPDGNLFAGGCFEGNFTFGSCLLQSTAGQDGMLLKYNAENEQLWGLDLNSSGTVEVRYIEVDSEGNIIISGRFYDHALHIGDTTLSNHGSLDIFIAKLTTEGELIWAKSFGGNNKDFIMGMCTDHENNIYLTGGFHSQSFIIDTTLYTNNTGLRAAVIIQMDESGTISWAEMHDEGYDQQFMAIDVDSAQNIYTGGYFKGTFNFGSHTLTNSAGHFDVFLAKYNADHEPQWINKISSEAYERTDNIVLDNAGNIYIEIVTFGNATFENTVLPYQGERDLAVGKYTPDGSLSWAFSAGGIYNDEAAGMAIGPLSNVYLTGYFKSPLFSIGPFQLLKSDTTQKDAFIIALGPDCILPDPGFSFERDSMSVQFTADGLADYYLWDFGDGDTSTLQNPLHTYDSLGFYTVSLTVNDICGQNTSSQEIRICEDPLADFETLPNFMSVSFIQLSQLASEYYWDFGDGTYSTEAEPVHTYPEFGMYVVCLTASNQCGTDHHYDTVWLQAPMCNFNFQINNGLIYFTDESLDANSFFWEFGDGSISHEQHPVHQYEDFGTYECCLTIENEFGVFTHCNTVLYCDIAQAEFQYLISGEMIALQDVSINSRNWFWDFGDGETSLLENPRHQYASAGEYTICLTASNICSQDNFCQTINVEAPSGEVYFTTDPEGDILKLSIPYKDKYQAIIYNTRGIVCIDQEFYSQGKESLEIDISSLTNGIYILEIKSSLIHKKQKFIISEL